MQPTTTAHINSFGLAHVFLSSCSCSISISILLEMFSLSFAVVAERVQLLKVLAVNCHFCLTFVLSILGLLEILFVSIELYPKDSCFGSVGIFVGGSSGEVWFALEQR